MQSFSGKRWTRLVLTVVVIGIAPLAVADDFRWSRDIDLPALQGTSLVTVALDSHFFEFTRADSSDVRLVIGGAPSGLRLRVATAAGESHGVLRRWTAEQTSAKLEPGVGLQLELFSREPNPVPDKLTIQTPLRDFEDQVTVETSADGTVWTSLEKPFLIFDYSQYVDARNVAIPLPASGHRHIRLTIADITAEQESQLLDLQRQLVGKNETQRNERTTIQRRPFRIDKVEFSGTEQMRDGEHAVNQAYPIRDFSVFENAKSHTSQITFDTRREPITQITLQSAATNFSRAARVEVPSSPNHDEEHWQTIAQGNLTRLALGDIHREDLSLAIPETRSAHFRVVVENQDSPAIAWSGTAMHGPAYEMVFVANPGERATLHYGSPKSARGQYDTAALETALARHQPKLPGTLGEPQEHEVVSSSEGSSPAKWDPWNDRRVQIAAIVTAAILLAVTLFKAAKRVTLPPE